MATSTPKPTCSLVSITQDPNVIRKYTFKFKFEPNGSSYKTTDVDHYEFYWVYANGSGIAYYEPDGSDGNKTSFNYVVWEAPENVTRFHLKIRPVGKEKSSKDKTPKFTGAWLVTQNVELVSKNHMPERAPAPTVTIDDKYNLTTTVSIYDRNTTHVKFRVVQDDTKEFTKSGLLKVQFNSVTYTVKIEPGHTYRVQCIAYNEPNDIYTYDRVDGNNKALWSEYSGNEKTVPSSVTEGSLTVTARTVNSVFLKWTAVKDADSYEIEYSNAHIDFTSSGNTQTEEATSNQKIIYNLEIGTWWWFRVRAKNAQGTSSWTHTVKILLGKAPTAPTTWSSVIRGSVGDYINLYWIHNTVDGSKMSDAEINLVVNGVTNRFTYAEEILSEGDFNEDGSSPLPDDSEPEKTHSYRMSPLDYHNGEATIIWQVRTKGIIDEYSPWSIPRTIKIYQPPSVTLSTNMTDTTGGKLLTGFPLNITANASPSTQTPIGWQVTFTSLSQYTAYSNSGDIARVNVNDVVFTEFYPITNHNQQFVFTPERVTLANYAKYKMEVTVSMDSGLSATNSYEIEVRYRNRDDYMISTDLWFDKETMTATISPRCYRSSDGAIMSNVHFTVMRINYDNKLTKIMDGIDNLLQTTIIDPYPTLDYMRYRIIIFFMETGQIEYYDTDPEYVGVKDVVLNWNESGLGRVASLANNDIEDPRWIGGMIRLPWNVDVTDTLSPEAELVSYIGREYDVAYYGTKVNHSSNWAVMIDKEDRETILALRTIGVWRNNVYVREPSGTGYWAQIELNMSQKHNEPGVPVSLTIKRVEGGE